MKGLKIIYEPAGRAKEYASLALNLFRGCLNGCTYCYVPKYQHMEKEDFYNNCTIRKNWKENLEKDLIMLKHMGMQDVEVMLSFTSDPFQDRPDLQNATHEALSMMKAIGQRFACLTKTPTKMLAKTAGLFKGESFGITLTKIVSFAIEPNADNWMKRVTALQMMKEMGASTFISFEPVISYNDTFFFYEKTKSFCDLYRVGAASIRLSDIDYAAFTKDFVFKMKADGAKYYIKESLRMFL